MSLLNKRASGILMHISSLPDDFGIGTFGSNAYRFVDFLVRAGQTYWQILPIGPTSYGDSPYQSFSTFAGNPYFIDLKILSKQGFLKRDDFQNLDWGQNPRVVDYSLLYKNRKIVFNKLYENFVQFIPPDFNTFCAENNFWLDDYALFMALKDLNDSLSFYEWDDLLKKRRKSELEKYKKTCADKIQYHKMLQYFFFKQWNELKTYANKNGIKIIGDLPIYVSSDSADVWSNPNLFYLNEDLLPIEVAGCPPDAFSTKGQLWGNPVYDWNFMKKSEYAWWKKRIFMGLKFYDVIRIDHFRGLDSYYAIPYGSEDATNGKWKKGPGIDFINSLKKDLGELPLIAEDLGFLTLSVKRLLKQSDFMGMKVLQFAFDSKDGEEYLPFNYSKNTVVYTGTHDNNTLKGWIDSCYHSCVDYACNFFRIQDKAKLAEEMMICALSSVSNICILTIQDLIGLGSEARMNTPSVVGGNWTWRATTEEMDSISETKLKYFTELYGRKSTEHI